MAVVYSTSDVHPRDSVPYWVEVVTKGFVKYALTPTGGPAFRASVRAGSLDGLGVSWLLDDRSPLTGLAFGFLTKLPGQIEALGAMAASKIAEHALDLVALAFSAEIQPSELTLSSPRAVALTVLKTNIEALLRETDLRPLL